MVHKTCYAAALRGRFYGQSGCFNATQPLTPYAGATFKLLINESKTHVNPTSHLTPRTISRSHDPLHSCTSSQPESSNDRPEGDAFNVNDRGYERGGTPGRPREPGTSRWRGRHDAGRVSPMPRLLSPYGPILCCDKFVNLPGDSTTHRIGPIERRTRGILRSAIQLHALLLGDSVRFSAHKNRRTHHLPRVPRRLVLFPLPHRVAEIARGFVCTTALQPSSYGHPRCSVAAAQTHTYEVVSRDVLNLRCPRT